jgi:hypothetical protein
VYIRLYYNKYTLRSLILLIIEKKKREEAKENKDGEKFKGNSRD